MQDGSHTWRRDDALVEIPGYTETSVEDLGIER